MPTGSVRAGVEELNGEFVINPTSRTGMSTIDLVVSGTENAVTMVEASGKQEVPEEEMVGRYNVRTCIYQRNCTTPKGTLSKCGKKQTYSHP